MTIDCRRFNVFIGYPNTGKSNILEAIAALATGPDMDFLPGMRFEDYSNIFREHDISKRVVIETDSHRFTLDFKGDEFHGDYRDMRRNGKRICGFKMSGSGRGGSSNSAKETGPYKFYRFEPLKEYTSKCVGALLPPCGKNLLTVIQTNTELKTLASSYFEPYGMQLLLRPHERKIEAIWDAGGAIVSTPFSMLSATLRRMIFYAAAILSNSGAVIALEEPESHSFPLHTQSLAEMIALCDRGNQYFLSTHNPYFLLSLLEKAPKQDIAIHIVRYNENMTTIQTLKEDQIQSIVDLDHDVFLNLEHFLEEVR